MLSNLKAKNPDIEVYDVRDAEFAGYGEVISDVDFSALSSKALGIKKPESGSAYLPSIAELEADDCFDKVKNDYFGGMDIQIGLCWGYNSMLDALEYHKCTEINVAAKDMVVLLARLSDLHDCILDSSDVKAFFVPAGTAIEIYNSTLHYCPCQTSDDGFCSVVVLMKGTNEDRGFDTGDKRIIGKNKWVLYHSDAVPADGFTGITGKNIKLLY